MGVGDRRGRERRGFVMSRRTRPSQVAGRRRKMAQNMQARARNQERAQYWLSREAQQQRAGGTRTRRDNEREGRES